MESRLPEPHPNLRLHFIGRSMRMEFHLEGDDRPISTSPVAEIRELDADELDATANAAAPG